jgi:hemerythrin-like domain-containing protein
MQARGLLMIEHRLIERLIALIARELKHIGERSRVDPVRIDTVVDFIRFYADRTHHGKEEDILFRELAGKRLSDDDRRTMEELIQEHRFGRETTGQLVEANGRYRAGDPSALPILAGKLRTLAEFYPKHITKEDKVFFPASMNYLSAQEQQSMLEEFWEFDRKMIHEKYKSVVETLEKR